MNEKRKYLFKNIACNVMNMSSCQKRGVGALIVDGAERIVATGYNGTAPGGFNCNAYFDAPTTRVCMYITDVLPEVVCLNPGEIYDGDKIVIQKENSTDIWVEVSADMYRTLHKMFAARYEIHAEQNALFNVLKTDTYIGDNASIFVTLEPCLDCAKAIIASGIKHVYYINKHESNKFNMQDYFGKHNIAYEQV